MRALELLNLVGWMASQTAKEVAGGAANLLGRINPDVWRELRYTSMAAYSIALPKREPIVDRGEDGFLPVILVHGLGSNRGTWWPLRLFLMVNGHKRVYAFGYEGGTVEQHAASLKLFIEQVMEATGQAQVDLVAHSLGGLISRYAIQRLSMESSVRTLITLATPHHGSYAAVWANTSLTRALRPDSDIVRDLNADDITQSPVRFVTLSSPRDIYVVPPEAMLLSGAENIILPETSHTQHIFSPQVFRIVANRLPAILA